MFYSRRFPALLVLFGLGWFPALDLIAQEETGAAATEAKEDTNQRADSKPEKPSLEKPAAGNAGQEDLDEAMELKMSANDIDKNTRVIERIEQALKKGIPDSDACLGPRTTRFSRPRPGQAATSGDD